MANVQRLARDDCTGKRIYTIAYGDGIMTAYRYADSLDPSETREFQPAKGNLLCVLG